MDEQEQTTGLPLQPHSFQEEDIPQEEFTETQPQVPDLSTTSPQLPSENVGSNCDYCVHKEKYQHLTDDYITKSQEKESTPFLEELTLLLDKDTQTIEKWYEDPLHTEFTKAINKLRLLQRLRLMEQSTGRFTHNGAIFLLTKLHNL